MAYADAPSINGYIVFLLWQDMLVTEIILMAKTPAKKAGSKRAVTKKAPAKKRGRPALATPKPAVVAREPAPAPKKNSFEERFGEGTAFDLDYGKLLIIALCVYIAVQVS